MSSSKGLSEFFIFSYGPGSPVLLSFFFGVGKAVILAKEEMNYLSKFKRHALLALEFTKSSSRGTPRPKALNWD